MKYSSYERPNGNSLYNQGAVMPAPCAGCGSKALPMGGTSPALPTGVPTGPSTAPIMGGAPATTQMQGAAPMTQMQGAAPMAQMQGAAPSGAQPPLTTQNIMFTPGFLSTQIGKLMRVEFLIGTNGPLVDRVGTLIGVGTSYILLRPTGSDDVLLCDMYSIKFVTILL